MKIPCFWTIGAYDCAEILLWHDDWIFFFYYVAFLTYIYIYTLLFSPVQRTDEQRFFVALTTYYYERITKIKTYIAILRQIKCYCHHLL